MATQQTSVSLSFAQLDYLLNDYVTLVAGYMVLPLGTYSERAAGWLNKIPDDPLPVDFLPGAGVGAQLRGSVPVGNRADADLFGLWRQRAVVGWRRRKATTLDADGNTIPNLDLSGNVGVNTDGSSRQPQQQSQRRRAHRLVLSVEAHYDVELGVSGQAGTWDAEMIFGRRRGGCRRAYRSLR